MAKQYPLEIENVSHDEYIVMSRGHHDIHAFMKAVRAEGYDWRLGVPVHRWAKVTPDSTGEHTCLYHFVEEGVRGAFPVTYAWEASLEGQYDEVFKHACKTMGPTCRGCPDCGPVMGHATYQEMFGQNGGGNDEQ